jgi:hypothetical protein
MATTTRPHAQAHANSVLHCLMATTTRKQLQHHHMLTTSPWCNSSRAVSYCALRNGNNDNKNGNNTIIFHIASHDGNINNNNGNSRIVMHAGNDDNNKLTRTTECASAPGFQPLCTSAQTTASNIDATTSQVTSNIDTHNLQRSNQLATSHLDAFRAKITVKHRWQQPFQCQT